MKSTYGYVAVEDVRFTGNAIGISTGKDIISLTNAAVVVDGALSASWRFPALRLQLLRWLLPLVIPVLVELSA